nr:hypothetical protein CFP56_25411 [Quercus suber]
MRVTLFGVWNKPESFGILLNLCCIAAVLGWLFCFVHEIGAIVSQCGGKGRSEHEASRRLKTELLIQASHGSHIRVTPLDHYRLFIAAS